MPVKRCAFFRPSNIIRNSDLNSVTPVGFNCWTGYLAIDYDNTLVDTIWSFETTFDNEGVGSYDSSRWGLFIRIRIGCRL